MSRPEVSVVVPTHNRGDLLPRLLRSVLAQRDVDFELVVVDDGSSDHTPQVLTRCQDRRVRVVRHERARGVSAARNSGTEQARGRWVAWCDDDDVWAPDKLRLQLQSLAETPGARWSNGGSVYVDSALRVSRITRCPVAQDVARNLLRVNAVTGGGSGVLADRELVLSLGGFDTGLSMYADWEMWARLAYTSPLAVVDLPLVGYVEHAGGMSTRSMHLAFQEIEPLQRTLRRLAAASGQQVPFDRRSLAMWMLRQQTASGGRRGNVVLPFRLMRSDLLSPLHATAYAVAMGVAPRLLQRRWAGYWRLDDDYMTYARGWLRELHLPPVAGEPRVRHVV